MPEPHTVAYSNVEGCLTFYISTWECGCWHEEGFNADSELAHLRFQVCPDCWSSLERYLDNLEVDRKAQLTLLLPSRTVTEGDGYE